MLKLIFNLNVQLRSSCLLNFIFRTTYAFRIKKTYQRIYIPKAIRQKCAPLASPEISLLLIFWHICGSISSAIIQITLSFSSGMTLFFCTWRKPKKKNSNSVQNMIMATNSAHHFLESHYQYIFLSSTTLWPIHWLQFLYYLNL